MVIIHTRSPARSQKDGSAAVIPIAFPKNCGSSMRFLSLSPVREKQRHVEMPEILCKVPRETDKMLMSLLKNKEGLSSQTM